MRPACARHPAPQAKTHEKVDSIGEERSIACHAVVMLIRKELAPPPVPTLSPELIPVSDPNASVSSLWDSQSQ